MSVADQRLLGEPAPKFSEGLVFNLGKMAGLEGRDAAASNQSVQRPYNSRVKLAALVFTQLIHRTVMADRFPVYAIRRHRFIGVRHNDDAGAQTDFIARESIRVSPHVIVFTVLHSGRMARRTECARL